MAQREQKPESTCWVKIGRPLIGPNMGVLLRPWADVTENQVTSISRKRHVGLPSHQRPTELNFWLAFASTQLSTKVSKPFCTYGRCDNCQKNMTSIWQEKSRMNI